MKYFEVVVQVRHESEDSKGNVKVKKLSEVYLVDAVSVTEAEARIVKLLSGTIRDFEVIQVKSSKIIEVVGVPAPKTKEVNNSKELPTEKEEL